MAQSRDYSGTYVEGLRKIRKTLKQHSRCACSNSNRGLLEYKPTDLPLRQFTRYVYAVVRHIEVSHYGYLASYGYNYQEVSN
jgi:hypothetical protein